MKYPGIENQPDSGAKVGALRRTVQRFLRAQFGRPTGFWGNIAGLIMVNTRSNKERIRWTVSLLDIRPGDRLLEIGFGPGYAIELVNKMAPAGFVAGVDHSEVMVRHAGRRNARAVREGRVALLLGSASDLPKFSEPFDKIFTINSIHFWTEPVDCLRRLRELLKPGGMIAVTLQPRSRGATDATTGEIGKEIAANLERAGFTQVRLETRQTKPVAVACALGIR
ncbi:MAG: class I SAM-dependent methyltransferase [Thermodesulfovibrionales bacterium]